MLYRDAGPVQQCMSEADRLLCVACAALRSGTLYNPEFAGKKSTC
jgi:hypothetical protein